ncbi:MAG TPA: CheR family methyltransferase [Actinoplanes sp.]|nr:CheR family methyltransferase [Actinoplanes sp.]
MTARADIDQFRAVLAARLGWTFAENDVPQLATVLTQRAGGLALGDREYLVRLGAGRWASELVALTEDLAITETYFFRHGEQFRALSETALPQRIAAQQAQRTLRLLSVGCSSGEEAYTLALVARDVQPDPAWEVHVLGIDANPAMLRAAAAGRYSAWSLRETPEAVRRRWFRPHDDEYELDPAVRASVRFRRHNVADDDPALWRPGLYDVLFCRNLLMYLTPAARAALIRRMTGALAPGGFLFLGHTDSLGSRPEGLEPIQAQQAFYYRRLPPDAPRPAPPERAPRRRIPAPPPGPGPHERAGALLAAERFGEALAVVEAGLVDQPHPRDLLLYGVLLAQAGHLDRAETVCRRLLDADGLYADAHHLLAVCFDGGDPVEAIGHYRLAAYLDATFALPRLRLGLLARQHGDYRGAGLKLDRALSLLPEEREERIVLFGGGFGRAALTALCRAELDAIRVRR